MLQTLSQKSGIQLITNTGYYGAANNKFLPPHALEETSDELAIKWTKEWKEGINGTGIKPGFIKIGVNPEELSELHQKLVKAAARTHLQSGLTIASHRPLPCQRLNKLNYWRRKESLLMHLYGYTRNRKKIYKACNGCSKRSMDKLKCYKSEDNNSDYLKMVDNLKRHGLLSQTLLSQDAGWYSPGEKNGGDFRGYNTIVSRFIPLLRGSGYSKKEIQQLFVLNPRNAL